MPGLRIGGALVNCQASAFNGMCGVVCELAQGHGGDTHLDRDHGLWREEVGGLDVIGWGRVDADGSEPVHGWFGLTYANYLVLPRTLLQSMPAKWQRLFIRMVSDLQAAFAHVEWPDSYQVRALDVSGRFRRDPVPHYDRGRAHVEPRISP